MNPTRNWLSIAALLLAAGAVGCENGSAEEKKPAAAVTATAASATAAATAAAAPASADARKFSIDAASSKVDFLMEAVEEKIAGHVPGATTGDLQVDLMDVTRSTGTITVDIGGLTIFQARADKSGKFGDEVKVDKQNEHARTWLEISPDAPPSERAKNSAVRFTIKSIEASGEKNVLKMTGAERKVMLKVTGELTVHQHPAQKVAELEATFRFDGDKPVSVAVKTVKPIVVGLVEYDVKPRDAFGKFALKTLEKLSSKVAVEAPVTLEFTAKLAEGK
jgi:polyisoprenoid-binding protein YceI